MPILFWFANSWKTHSIMLQNLAMGKLPWVAKYRRFQGRSVRVGRVSIRTAWGYAGHCQMVLVTRLLVRRWCTMFCVARGGNHAVKVLLFLYNKLPFRVGRWYVATSRIASLKEWQW